MLKLDQCGFIRLLIVECAAKWQTRPHHMALNTVQLPEPTLTSMVMLLYVFVYVCKLVICLLSL